MVNMFKHSCWKNVPTVSFFEQQKKKTTQINGNHYTIFQIGILLIAGVTKISEIKNDQKHMKRWWLFHLCYKTRTRWPPKDERVHIKR